MKLGKAGFKIVDIFRKTDVLGIYPDLLESQWQTPAELENLQFERLRKLLIHAGENVEFYRNSFQRVGFNPKKITSFKDLEVLPVITKDDIRKDFEKFKSDNFESYLPRITRTGGSTGKPFITYRDKISHSYLWGNNYRAWNAGGYELGDKIIEILTGSLVPKAASFKTKIYFLMQNADVIPTFHLTENRIKTIIDEINNSNSEFIYGYSSSMNLIASYGKLNNLKIRDGFRSVFTTSDMLYPDQRRNIEEYFRVNLFDIYGCPEGGVITFECEKHSGYHINQESVYIEIVNQQNGLGNIISTPLFNYAFPLIRYNTGDVGKLTRDKCECGRGLSKISELGGRIRDFIKLKDGRFIHGAFFNKFKPLYDKQWIEQYQVVQENLDELTVKMKLAGDPVKEDLNKIESELKKGLLPDLKINFDFNGVEYTGGGKFRLVISKVKNEWEKV